MHHMLKAIILSQMVKTLIPRVVKQLPMVIIHMQAVLVPLLVLMDKLQLVSIMQKMQMLYSLLVMVLVMVIEVMLL
jgi:hypothetical protein